MGHHPIWHPKGLGEAVDQRSDIVLLGSLYEMLTVIKPYRPEESHQTTINDWSHNRSSPKLIPCYRLRLKRSHSKQWQKILRCISIKKSLNLIYKGIRKESGTRPSSVIDVSRQKIP
jgi:hypothetical protein